MDQEHPNGSGNQSLSGSGSSGGSTGIFVKIMFTCPSHDISNAYVGRWVDWSHVPRVGDRVLLMEGFDEEVTHVIWHIAENAVEVVVTFDCDPIADGVIDDGEKISWNRVYGIWMKSAYRMGFDHKHGSHESLTGLFCVPKRR